MGLYCLSQLVLPLLNAIIYENGMIKIKSFLIVVFANYISFVFGSDGKISFILFRVILFSFFYSLGYIYFPSSLLNFFLQK